MIESGFAQDIPPPDPVPETCDPDFWQVIDARAWMEGSREVEVAQRLLLKPDSVLEYTCFETRGLQMDGAGIFSTETYVPGFPPIQGLVLSALGEYLRNNFAHSYGGNTVNPGGGCNSMQAVWDALRCHDFDDEKFMTFEELLSSDPRDKPGQCNVPGRAGLWQAALQATNTPATSPPTLGGPEAAINYPALIGITSCTDVNPIGTGVPVRIGGQLRQDAVCPAAGCYFNGEACTP